MDVEVVGLSSLSQTFGFRSRMAALHSNSSQPPSSPKTGTGCGEAISDLQSRERGNPSWSPGATLALVPTSGTGSFRTQMGKIDRSGVI